MLGAHPIEVALGSTYDRTQLKTILAAMANANLAVFFLQHLEKEPAPEQVIAPAALKKLRADGANLGHGLATTNKAKLTSWLKRWRDNHPDDVHPNIALNPGLSRLIVVDVDTAVEKRAFLDYWAEAEGWAADPNSQWPEADITPTVLTPGDHDAAGNLIHSDGGHYYFTLPDGWEVPQTGPGIIKMPGKWAIYMRDCYVLVPPSVRAEGAYLLAGDVHEAPSWLLEAAGSKQRPVADPAPDVPTPGPDTSGDRSSVGPVVPSMQGIADGIRSVEAAEYAEEVLSRAPQSIDDWSAEQSWDELLTTHDFVPFKPDKCGDDCMIYTDVSQPHSSRKSATAHGPVCTQYDPAMGHGPLHFWTDNAPDGFDGKGTYTMLQFVAIKDHGGDTQAALDALGLSYTAADLKRLSDVRERLSLVPERPEDEDDDGQVIRPFGYYWDEPPPAPLIDSFLFRQSHTMLVGAPSAGKSFVALDMAAAIATGRPYQGLYQVQQGKVIYLVGEGFKGFVQRGRAWAFAYDQVDAIQRDIHIVRDPYSLPGGDRQETDKAVMWWARFVEQAAKLNPELIIIDTLARVTVGLKENDASDMGQVNQDMADMIDHLDTTIMLVHHTSRSTNHARGSTALLGSVDSEFLVYPDPDLPKGIRLKTTKQKDAEQHDELSLVITPHGASAYVAPLTLRNVAAASAGAAIEAAVVDHLSKSDRVKVRLTDITLALSTTYSRPAVQSAIDALLSEGTLEHPDGARGRPLTTSVQLSDKHKTAHPQEEDTNEDTGSTD